MNFSADITKWVEKTKLSGSAVMRKITFDCMVGIMQRSPVKYGRFRGSHRIGINQVDPSVEPPPPEGAKTVRERFGTAPSGEELAYINRQVAQLQWGDTAHITNNLNYARDLENGLSPQNNHQVDGIYGATFAEQVAKLDSTIRTARIP